MRVVVVSLFVSVDGVAEGPDRWPVDWDDDAMDAHQAAALESQDAVILGRRSYDEWAPFWPTATIEPYATFINTTPKYVITSTPLEQEWANTQRIEGGLVDFVRQLRSEPGGDIGVHASVSVARSLLAAGLVDRLSLAIMPVIAGTGRRLLDGVPARQLETVRSTSSSKGNLLVDYRVGDLMSD